MKAAKISTKVALALLTFVPVIGGVAGILNVCFDVGTSLLHSHVFEIAEQLFHVIHYGSETLHIFGDIGKHIGNCKKSFRVLSELLGAINDLIIADKDQNDLQEGIISTASNLFKVFVPNLDKKKVTKFGEHIAEKIVRSLIVINIEVIESEQLQQEEESISQQQATNSSAYFWKDADITDFESQQKVYDFITNHNQQNSNRLIEACNYEEKEFRVEDGSYICFGHEHYIGLKIESKEVSIFDSVTENETHIIKDVKKQLENHNLVKGHENQLVNQCWGRAFLYLAENKTDVDGNDANKYMNENYLSKKELGDIYEKDGTIKKATTLDIGTMTKLVEYYNVQNRSKPIRIVLVNNHGEMNLSQRNNKLLSDFSYEQYQELLNSGFTAITEHNKQYILSEDEYARVLNLLPGNVEENAKLSNR